MSRIIIISYFRGYIDYISIFRITMFTTICVYYHYFNQYTLCTKKTQIFSILILPKLKSSQGSESNRFPPLESLPKLPMVRVVWTEG